MIKKLDFTNDWYDSLNDAFAYELWELVYIYIDAIEDTDSE